EANDCGAEERGSTGGRAEGSTSTGGTSEGRSAPGSWLRRPDRCRGDGAVEALASRAVGGDARAREAERQSQGRDRRTRECDCGGAGEGKPDGTQERTWLLAQRARLESEDARREDLLGPGGQGRDDHRAPARNEV